MVLDFLAVDNFDFTRKIVKKNLGEKKCWGSDLVGFTVSLDPRCVCCIWVYEGAISRQLLC